jgi:hypothetical protein
MSVVVSLRVYLSSTLLSVLHSVTQRSQGQAAEWKSSSDWLLTHSLYSSSLSLSTLLSHGTTKIRQVCDRGQLYISGPIFTKSIRVGLLI